MDGLMDKCKSRGEISKKKNQKNATLKQMKTGSSNGLKFIIPLAKKSKKGNQSGLNFISLREIL